MQLARTSVAVVTFTLSGFGCASTELSADHLTSLTAAIRAADEVGAADTPQAALHLKLAQDELAQGKQLAAAGDPVRGELFLQRAAVDAELALVLTRQGDAEAEAEKARQAVVLLEGGVR